jgi:hypothetical protein
VDEGREPARLDQPDRVLRRLRQRLLADRPDPLDVPVEELVGLDRRGHAGVRLALLRDGHPVVADRQVYVLECQESLVERAGHGHRVEERRRRLVPQLVQVLYLERERRVGGEQVLAAVPVELHGDGGVERDDRERDAGREHGLCRGHVGLDVPLRLGLGLAVVSDRDRPAHEHDSLDPLGRLRLVLEEAGHVRQRAQRDDRQPVAFPGQLGH